MTIIMGSTMSLTPTVASPHPFSIHDMLAMERLGGINVSPDGSLIAFTRRTTDLAANRSHTDIWTVNVDGTNMRRLTSHESSSSSPRWSPDGTTIFFLSSRKDSSQVWRIAVDGGEAGSVTDFPLDVTAFVVSPTGTHLAVCMDVFPDSKSPADTKARLDEISERKSTGRVYDKLFVRHWDHWKDGRRSHVFAVPVKGGDAVDVMAGMDADSPSKPFGGDDEITFTPDGKSIVFSARDVGNEEAWSTNFDLFVSPIDGSAKPRCLTSDNKAWDTHPVFSPDGKTLSYLAMQKPGYESDRMRIVLMDWPAGKTRSLTEDWDRSGGAIVWSADSKTIYSTAANLGQRSLFAIDLKSSEVRTLVHKGNVRSPGIAGDRIVFGMDHLRSPVELYTVSQDGTNPKQITHVNDEKLADTQMGEPEQFTFKGAGGDTVYAYVVKPANFDPSKKYPVAFLIHGGPQGSFGNDFHYRWNPQAYAGAGYAAVMVDFHGSTGYGQAFCDAIHNDWGGKPFEDLQKGLEATLKRYPWMDGDRVSALGASFGGFMINWIAGNWPDRFKCLVNHDGNLDERMAYYDTEELWFPEWDHAGTPWEHPQNYTKHNPVNHVDKWKTPMLVIHGALDYRVVDTQGIATFTVLQRRGVPSKFLYFPDENHWVLQPANSVLWHETVIAWLDQWTK
ncbi:MAG: S9 family peptidase [Planctomycetes bacterium]|nr:S9 family peptidase [Planctomycetota bacterium]